MKNPEKLPISRYSRLMHEYDSDFITNGNWNTIDTSKVDTSETSYNFIDLFAGAGGISVGATQAGLKKVFSVEIDKDASETIRNNFPDSIHYEGPIQDLKKGNLINSISKKKINVVFGGPPCQGFSVAGLRNPKDARNQLFKEYIRIVDYLKPEFILMENVPGILTMQKGAVAREILKQFDDIGYKNVSIRILEAAKYGVPQLRARAIFIGNRLGVKNPYPKSIKSQNDYNTIYDAIDDLKKVDLNPDTNHVGTKHSKNMEERISKVPHGKSLYESFQDAYKRQYKNLPSMAVKENHGGVHIHYELNRVLTAREMARLQTFPDDFIFSGTFKRAYWQIGNAVPCLMAKHLALAIKERLNELNT